MADNATVICIGELIADLFPEGDNNAYRFEPGGAPANVAVAMAALGHTVALVSRVGDDHLGAKLVDHLLGHGVDTSMITIDAHSPSDLSLVQPKQIGGGFRVYRPAGASWITPEVIRRLDQAQLVHLGSLVGSSDAGRAGLEVLLPALSSAPLVSVDVNLRPSAWPDAATMVAAAHELIEHAHVVKATRDELTTLGLTERDLAELGRVWLVTDGPAATSVVYGDLRVVQDVPVVEVVDSTGAGDASFAAFLDVLVEIPWRAGLAPDVVRRGLVEAAEAAAVAGSTTVQFMGATPPARYPDRREA